MHTDINTITVGVCVGRFQTHKLHEGHIAILNAVNNCSIGMVFLGVAPTPVTKKNPMNYHSRIPLVAAHLRPGFIILPIHDHVSDLTWSENLDKEILKNLPHSNDIKYKVRIYHSRDSFADYYHGQFECVELRTIGEDVNATKLREQVGKTVLNTEDFRAGIIYASQNMYPRVQPTVDIAILDKKKNQILLGKKPGTEHLCFVGGFIDMTDETAANAAIRELKEETNIDFPINDLKWINTVKIRDWRDTTNTSVMTTFFLADITDLNLAYKAMDDIETLQFYDFNIELRNRIQDSHKVLFDMLFQK